MSLWTLLVEGLHFVILAVNFSKIYPLWFHSTELTAFCRYLYILWRYSISGPNFFRKKNEIKFLHHDYTAEISISVPEILISSISITLEGGIWYTVASV